jgi:hypothetical protein
MVRVPKALVADDHRKISRRDGHRKQGPHRHPVRRGPAAGLPDLRKILMRIASLEIRACSAAIAVKDEALRGAAGGRGASILCYTLRTECGRSASMFGFAGASAGGSAIRLAKSLEPFLVGRSVHEREALWHDFRLRNRMWGHLPIYIWGPIDCCLWLLAAEAAGLPLYRYIGAARTVGSGLSQLDVPRHAEDYAAEALAAQGCGLCRLQDASAGQIGRRRS